MKTHQRRLLRAFIIGALLTLTASTWAQGTWTTNTPMLSTAIETSGASYGGKFYVIDGDGTTPQIFDPGSTNWSYGTADPVFRSFSAVGVISNKIYAAEGWQNSDASSPTTDLEIYDPVADSWSAGASSLLARGETASAVIGGKLYITGGYRSGPNFFTTLEIYDPNANSWSTNAPMPIAVADAVGAAINGKFYVVGGYAPSLGQATTNLYIYDPVANTWTNGTAMPAPRVSAVGGVINGEWFITGGSPGNGGVVNPVFIYNPVTDSWSTGADEPTPSNIGAAAVINDNLYVAGGYTSASSARTTELDVYTPTPVLNVAIKMFAGIILTDGQIGSNYLIQATASLSSSNWTTLTNVTLPSSPYIYIDYSSYTNSQQFYRVVQQ